MRIVYEPVDSLRTEDLRCKEEDTLALPWEQRRWIRGKFTTTKGREVGLALPTGTPLVPGTVILVEHRLDLTAKYTNHLIVMDQGKIRLEGDPRKILSNEETRLIGVGIPKATLLYQMLMKEGLDLGDKTPLSSEELAEHLLEALKPR